MKRIETILSQLANQGVRFRLEGETLHYRAPQGALDAETIKVLRARKQEIIDFLLHNAIENETGRKLPPLIARGNRSSPLSLGQQGLWVLYQLQGNEATYNIPETLWLHGSLDRNALKKSLQLLVDNHTVLRSSIRENGKNAYMHVAEKMEVELPVIGFSHLAPHKRRNLALERANAEVNAPFDLKNGPLLRACLMQVTEQDHIFCLTLHHIIADGWSKGLLSRSLAKAYNAFLQGKSPHIKPVEVTYHDFVYWQRDLLADQYLDPHIRYWQETLKDLPAPASIPTDRFRPDQPTGNGRVLRSELDSEITSKIRKIARESGCTLYMALAAVISELLRRYRNDSDIVFGTPTANRPFRELGELPGYFVNNLVMRVDVDGRLTFKELLQRVRMTTLDSFAHQIVPFEKVVEATGQRSPNFSPLFQIGFVLQDGSIELPELDGLSVKQIPVERTTAKYDLSLIAVEAEDRIELEWEYSTDLFAKETITNMAQSFQQLATEAVTRPFEPLQALKVCTREQQTLVVDNWSCSSQKTVPDVCLHDLVKMFAEQHPDRTAVVCGSRRLTYRELDQHSDAIALHLQRAGCGPESIVAVCLDRSVELITSILAILKSGGAYLPLDPDYPENRIISIVKDSGAQHAIAKAEMSGVRQTGITVIDPSQRSDFEDAQFNPKQNVYPDNLAYIIYTSGSTGTPKGVMIEHQSVVNLIAGLDETIYSHYSGPQQVSLFAATVFDASVQQIFAALCGGHTLHVLDTTTREDPRLLLEYWRKEKITIADGTPTLLQLLLEAGLAEAEGMAIKHLIIGGEPLPYETVKRLRSGHLGRSLALTNIYGPTECCVDVIEFTCPTDAIPELAVMPIGRPMVNTRAYILDERGLPVPPGMQGELYIGGPSVGRGYLGRDELTTESFTFNPFTKAGRLYKTGDRVRYLADGTIAFLGRSDDQLKVHGFRIEPGEIEHCLRSCDGVREAVVDVIQSDSNEPSLVAYLVVDGDGVALDFLRGFLAKRLPSYMIPAHFYTLAAFPRNKSGKVDRAMLPSLAISPLQPDKSQHCQPRSEKEQLLAAIWRDVLHTETPGINDNYFFLGGDSIKALQIVSRLRKHGYQIAIRDIFANPTLAGQALLLTSSKDIHPNLPVTGRLPLTAIQTWFMQRFKGNRNHFHQAILLRLPEPPDEKALQKALQALLNHHDALRSRFVRDETGGWQQEIIDLELAVDFQIVDYSGRSDATEAMREHSFKMIQRTNIAEGSLFKVALYRTGVGDRLLLTAHHLVVDGVSWRVLLQDLHLVYQQIMSGEAIDPGAKTTSVKQWSERLSEYGRSLMAEEVNRQGEKPHRRQTIPLPYTGSPFTYGKRRRSKRLLSSDLSKSLITDANLPYQTGITALLLCAFCLAAQRETGKDRFGITLEGHGREQLFKSVELDRTVGWFTIMYPIEVDLSSSREIGAQIRLVQQSVERGQATGIEYGLSRWCHSNGKNGESEPLPSVLFNYLGDFDEMLDSDMFELATEEIGPVIDPEAVVPFDLEVTGMCLGGRIELSIEYGPDIEPERIRSLMDLWAIELQTIVGHACSQNSHVADSCEVEYTGLAAEEVDSFLNTFTSGTTVDAAEKKEPF